MGRMVLEKGAKQLIIWDINEQNIAATCEEYKALGKVDGMRVDVSDIKCVEESAAQVKSSFGEVDILIQCAGIITSNKTFENQTYREIERTMSINSIAPMTVALQFLPQMKKRDAGHICTIASAAGMISNPKMSVYAASKWAVIGWSDSVRIELQEEKSNVHVTTVAPYYITTGMFDGVKSSFFSLLKPEKVARKVLKAIEKNRNFQGMPWPFHFIRSLQGLLPICMFDLIIGHILGIYHTMDDFTGRKN